VVAQQTCIGSGGDKAVSFICKACSKQRAGTSGEVCSDCWETQIGAAAKLFAYFERRRINEEFVGALVAILAHDARPDIRDGSITERRRARLVNLVQAAQALNDAIDAAIPQSHDPDW
jgi:hypothetical protein